MIDVKRLREATDVAKQAIWGEDVSEPCMWDSWHEQQKQKPPWLRSSGALICCPCRKCRRVF